MSVVALVLHHERAQALGLAQRAAGWLTDAGHRVQLPAEDAELADLGDHGVERLSDDVDLAVSIGGDGTMLRTVDLLGGRPIPVMGINVGQLGYLTEVEPNDWDTALKRFLGGSYTIDERMLLTVQTDSGNHLALNEAVLEKTPMGHTVRLSVAIDGEFFTTYAADGLIVSTPTGSTAYAFSARGPIVEPSHQAVMLTPVSPHMLFDRTMVLDPTALVRIEVCGHRPATLSIDGRNLVDLVEGDAVVCTASPFTARLVTFGGRDFHRILKAKFGLNDR